MVDSPAQVTSPTLSELYREGVKAFRGFLQALSEDDCRVIHLEQVHLPDLLDEYGRIHIWGSTFIAQKKYDPSAGSDHDSTSSVSAESDVDSDDDVKYQNNRMPKIRLLVQLILEQIGSLFDFSALRRRQKITDKHIISIDSKPHVSAPSNSDTLPLSTCLTSADESHVTEKVFQDPDANEGAVLGVGKADENN
ncbi:hypothetical protein X797_011186 [Metarhizium robertsii]|uniref:Uncharacterized protein n=1 Tax=Metarhizium robertsii TaxID=568076 RepID=A0A014PJ70_9HYPO|nr:hypothetical protein X797_011186 [Metarhizium robertsii]